VKRGSEGRKRRKKSGKKERREDKKGDLVPNPQGQDAEGKEDGVEGLPGNAGLL
jgi:hypothetical protein